ncbi:MAG: hypothetical protein BGO45_16535 [Microbacterium sp. 71-36]|uniref:hypothetical protein n=1 Tax=unclassified Microbacterium TaxID=2609290 RepID=UPI00086A8741|nr:MULTISPECIES: hypothetical protein [unclassified Microbacterium]MBN9212877.1 hypothetical protein [Microbacterium sp.]ODT40261.1 MAG: hypothetical protein ABS60_04605 [Microbacterium sp. SCN 71-17]OJV78262.1 MAG: hypothetical protein BGO45_16535 [Microbacterium sp. 71-36]
MPDAIKVDAIPGADIDPDAIDENARTIGTISGQVSEHGSNVHFKWQGMAGVYEAPESPTLLGLMAPVSSQATQVSDNLAEVSAALIAFAADVRPIKAELDSLRVQAQTFVDSIQGGVQVREINPAWTAAQSPYGGATAMPTYQGSWGSSTTGSSSAAAPDKYRTVTKEWHESQDHVDRNNELIAAVNAQQIKLWEAERACANRIRALYGAQPLHAATSEDDALGYGISEIPEGTEMPWGAEVERTEGCGEATAKFIFKDFLWEGIAVGGVWGTITGLGTLVLGYNPETGEFFSGDAWGAAWGNLGLIAVSGLANSPMLGPLFWTDSLAQATGMGGFLPQEVRDFKAKADEAALNTGKALIAWDKWQDDPGTALGESVFNVGTALIPVGGAAVAGVKTASTAASVVSKIAKVADFVDPAAFAMNGAMKLGGAGIRGLDGIIGRLGTDATDGFHLNTPDMPFVANDAAAGLRALDDAGVDLSHVTARVEDGVAVYEFPPTDAIPSGRIEMPAGSFDGVGGGDVPVRTDGGADAGVAAPVREPELVSAGGVRGETSPGPVNSIVEDAPVRTETGGAGESTVVREPSTETGGGSSHAGGESGGHGGSDTGNGGGLGRGDDASSAGRGDEAPTGGHAPDGDVTGPAGGDSPTGSSTTPASPGRVYSLMDGTEHTTAFAPEDLGGSRVTDPLLDKYGVTRTHFEDLINRPIDTLVPSEKTIVNGVRNELTAQVTPDTVFQKVLDQPHFDASGKLVLGQGENIVLRDDGVITGSVSVAQDTAHLTTPADFFRSLRLDYPNTNFLRDDNAAYVVRFQEQANTSGSVNPQLHSTMGGDGSVDHYSPPFTGNGFLKTGDEIIPEYRANAVNMREGAEMWEVLSDGTQRLFAVLRAQEWIPVG